MNATVGAPNRALASTADSPRPCPARARAAPPGEPRFPARLACKVECLGHRTGERIERAVTIKAVIAWRLAAMTLLGRETPELAAEVFCTELQMRVLRHFAKRRGMAEPANLGLAVWTIAGTARLRGIKRSGRAGRA